MKNLKVSMKLIAGFGTMFIIMIAIIISSVYSLITINSQISNYATRTVPNQNVVWSIRQSLMTVQRDMLTALAEDDMGKIKSIVDGVSVEAKNVAEGLDKLEKNSRIDPESLKQLREYLTEYASYRKEITTLLQNGDESSKAKAYQIYIDTYKPGIDKITSLMLEIAEGQNYRADQQAITSQKAYSSAIIYMSLLSIFDVIITLIIALKINRAITVPIKEIESAMESFSVGEFDKAVVTYTSKDEFGALSDSIRTTIGRISFIITDLTRGLNDIASGNFIISSDDEAQYIGAFAPLAESTYKIITDLSLTLSQISETAGQVDSGSEQVSSGAQSLSQGATEQASSIEELSATINEISEHIRKNANNAQLAKKYSEESGKNVENSNAQMKDMIIAMNEIDGKSGEIGKIIKTIEDIAFQTNILALNAAVEAARAGESGKGFAVVADEVRNLAGKSADAAKDTTLLIEETINAVKRGSNLADITAEAMEDLVKGSFKVTDLINQIAKASNEQAESVIQVTTGIEQISNVIQTNSASAEEFAAASEELSGQSHILKNLVANFKLMDVIQ